MFCATFACLLWPPVLICSKNKKYLPFRIVAKEFKVAGCLLCIQNGSFCYCFRFWSEFFKAGLKLMDVLSIYVAAMDSIADTQLFNESGVTRTFLSL